MVPKTQLKSRRNEKSPLDGLARQKLRDTVIAINKLMSGLVRAQMLAAAPRNDMPFPRVMANCRGRGIVDSVDTLYDLSLKECGLFGVNDVGA